VLLIKRLILNIVILFVIQSFSQSVEHIKKVYLQLTEKPLRFALLEIQKQTDINIIYDDELVDNISIDCNIDGSTPQDAIQGLLSGKDISYKQFNKNHYVIFAEEKPKPVLFSYKAVVEQETILDIDTSYSFTNPILITKTNLVYPPEALKNKVEGKVKVRLLINKLGSVDNSIVDKSSGSYLLDSTAVDYARTFKFVPAVANDEPVNVWLSMTFDYKVVYEN
jgi:TonB family protein